MADNHRHTARSLNDLVDEGQRMAAVEGPWKLAAEELDR